MIHTMIQAYTGVHGTNYLRSLGVSNAILSNDTSSSTESDGNPKTGNSIFDILVLCLLSLGMLLWYIRKSNIDFI